MKWSFSKTTKCCPIEISNDSIVSDLVDTVSLKLSPHKMVLFTKKPTKFCPIETKWFHSSISFWGPTIPEFNDV